MYGAALPRGPMGQVGAGLGQTTSTGTVTLVPPTVEITHTGQEETVDGVRMVFQMAPLVPTSSSYQALKAPDAT